MERVRRLAAAEEWSSPSWVICRAQDPCGRFLERGVALEPGATFTLTTRAVDARARARTLILRTSRKKCSPETGFCWTTPPRTGLLSTNGSDVVNARGHGRHSPAAQGGESPRPAAQDFGVDGQGRADLEFAIAQQVDYLALSFVRRGGDVAELKRCWRHGARPFP